MTTSPNRSRPRAGDYEAVGAGVRALGSVAAWYVER